MAEKVRRAAEGFVDSTWEAVPFLSRWVGREAGQGVEGREGELWLVSKMNKKITKQNKTKRRVACRRKTLMPH